LEAKKLKAERRKIEGGKEWNSELGMRNEKE
jgi:hypothetical protein